MSAISVSAPGPKAKFPTSPSFEWKLPDRTLLLGERTLIMGVLNVENEDLQDPDLAFARAIKMEEDGADIIDIGAEATSGFSSISEAEELRRLVPVLQRLRSDIVTPISVTTTKSGVAARALELGTQIVNDPSALTSDPDLARVACRSNAGLILSHTRPEICLKCPICLKRPLHKNAMRTIAADLEASVHSAVVAGIEKKRLLIGLSLVDKRIGCIAHLYTLKQLELPILVSTRTNKPEKTVEAMLASSVLSGANILRVCGCELKAMRAVVNVADKIRQAAN